MGGGPFFISLAYYEIDRDDVMDTHTSNPRLREIQKRRDFQFHTIFFFFLYNRYDIINIFFSELIANELLDVKTTHSCGGR